MAGRKQKLGSSLDRGRGIGNSLGGEVIRKIDKEQQERKIKVGRPTSEKKKIRLNFLFDEAMVADLHALASIKKTTLTGIVVELVANEIKNNRRDIDILKSIQK